ncbi:MULTISPECIES: hypothetical protein [Pseudomonas]|uniref:Uncharacterized protein n=2 Tax=Pseudomonas TaxID=286 RepID=A0A6S5U2R9_PSEPU|nr:MULTISPECIES: hypothetical protein [Pseudomonas]OBY89676.1 hypothetical protein A6723_005395 [Pseudomonas sp. AU11447]PJI71134.1 hypothetical protein CSW00_24965 [Pseudomonas sp. MR 02]CAB5678944.1 Uncharacterised protein [Pseudomonas putida]ELO0963406.1 hypothetical protein [Pseudomonas aeruginosa]EME0887176.1 hypothetical protein [Pseudomonas aeruginosa]
MALDSLERFALTQLLGMAGVLRTRWDLMDFDVLGRERTTSGFYTLIQQHEVLESLPSSLELILPITHHALKRGGYFVCWIEDDESICLEAVANQQPWPEDISPADVCWASRSSRRA